MYLNSTCEVEVKEKRKVIIAIINFILFNCFALNLFFNVIKYENEIIKSKCHYFQNALALIAVKIPRFLAWIVTESGK